jgi:acyl-CoA synthetase (AMP-forming)/AMP-acid ligase II
VNSQPPRLTSLSAYLSHHAAQAPHREAAVDEHSSISYSELDRSVTLFADRLRGAGIGAGHCVALLGTPGVPFWVCILGTQRAGAAWLGLNPMHTLRELTHVLNDAQPSLVMTTLPIDSDASMVLRAACEATELPAPIPLRSALDDAGGRLWNPTGDHAFKASRGLTSRGNQPPVSLIVYTSGSTGSPKGALLSAEGLAENGWWMAARMGFKPARGLVNLPINHVGCVGDLCATILVGGGTLVFMERFDAELAVRRIIEAGVTWLPQVPAQFQMMLAKGGLDGSHLAGVRHLTWGGAPMPEPLVRQLADWVPDLFNSYGLTECSGTISVTAPDASIDELVRTVGRPVAEGRVRVADESDQSVPVGEVGEVQIRGPHVFLGYLNQPDATARTFTSDGWLRTSDLGAFDATGNLLLRGRTQEMFKSGGYNVYPREVESVIESLTGVSLCAVVAVADPLWTEVGVAYVVAERDRVSEDALRHHCQSQLARYKLPKRFVICDSLPLLPIGKVDRARLKDEAQAYGTP